MGEAINNGSIGKACRAVRAPGDLLLFPRPMRRRRWGFALGWRPVTWSPLEFPTRALGKRPRGQLGMPMGNVGLWPSGPVRTCARVSSPVGPAVRAGFFVFQSEVAAGLL